MVPCPRRSPHIICTISDIHRRYCAHSCLASAIYSDADFVRRLPLLLREYGDRSEKHAITRFLPCPLLPTLPRNRQERPFVLPRIPRSWTWPGNLWETLSGCHDRPAL